MKTSFPLLLVFCCAGSLSAQTPARSSAPKVTGDYAADIGVVLEAQAQALAQAKEALQNSEEARDRTALQGAIKEMERSRAALEQARNAPDKLAAALAAEQAAYQALLKATPREYRLSRSRNRSQSGSSSGQPSQQELNQLEMTEEAQRYETERQAAAPQTAQQREQAETVDRLKQLARRQQDLNERLRELQTSLTEARTEQEREELQRQLKRLQDEERQLLADVDQLRQRMEQSPEASKQAAAQQQLQQTHTDVQRAAQELGRQSVSEALAAGARAEQNLQNLRDNLRQQSSSQFSEQMRRMRSEARDLASREDQVAKDLDSLNNSGQKSLDNASQRQSLVEQMNRQQSTLTNLLGQMRAVTEQAELTEPLLSKQLYDVIRRTEQMHTDNQLEVGSRLVDRGFLPQAGEVERSARQNIDELRQGVERAANSVLGSETEALRYAQQQLDDLANQLNRELAGGTNASGGSAAGMPNAGQTNSLSTAAARGATRPGQGRGTTNELAGASSQAAGGEPREGDEANPAQAGGAGRRASRPGQGAGTTNSLAGASSTPADGEAQAGNEANPAQAGQNGERAPQGDRADRQAGEQAGARQGQRSGQAQAGGNPAGAQDQPAPGEQANAGNGERTRRASQQTGGGAGGLGLNGPITGNSYMDWTDRMRDVEQAVDSQDVRNQLATVRERVGVFRRGYRQNGKLPTPEELQNQVLAPLALARSWVGQELSRAQNDHSLVPLDRDPVQDKYSDLVRKYYEKLGSPQ